MTSKHFLITGCLLTLLCFTQACTQANSENGTDKNSTDKNSADETSTAASQSLYSQIQQVANIEGCTTSSDCALLPIGNKPCGGPEAYMPYSKGNSDVAELEKLGQKYTDMRKQYNKENQIMGTCVVTPKPAVSCLRNQCVTSSTQGSNIQ